MELWYIILKIQKKCYHSWNHFHRRTPHRENSTIHNIVSGFHACDEVNILEYKSVDQEVIENMNDNEI